MIELPKGAFIVLQDDYIEEEQEAKASLIITQEDIKKTKSKPNTGEIIFTSPELTKYQLCKVVFRENFGETKIKIKGQEYLYFRDWDSQIFYVIIDDKK